MVSAKTYSEYAYEEESNKKLGNVLWFCHQDKGRAYIRRVSIVRETRNLYIVANGFIRHGEPNETHRVLKSEVKNCIYKTDFKRPKDFFALIPPKDFFRYKDMGDYWIL